MALKTLTFEVLKCLIRFVKEMLKTCLICLKVSALNVCQPCRG